MYILKHGTPRSKPKPLETTHFYCKTTRIHLLFFRTHLKSAKNILKNTVSTAPPVRPDLVAIFENASISTNIGKMKN